jgi:hypothetical protein
MRTAQPRANGCADVVEPAVREPVMKVFAACILGSLTVGLLGMVACNSGWDRTPTANAQEGVTTKTTTADLRHEERASQGPSSPFIAGVWKFIPTNGGAPAADTEFRFVNTTNETVKLEYAFFEADGTFCGCDRDTLVPNKTTTYTVLGEAQTASPGPNPPPSIPFQFSCHGTSGALQAFVFKNHGAHIFLDDTTQVGFQTHAFGGIVETPDNMGNFNFLTGNVMTEATMGPITISDSTRDDIRAIHEQCITVQGPL